MELRWKAVRVKLSQCHVQQKTATAKLAKIADYSEGLADKHWTRDKAGSSTCISCREIGSRPRDSQNVRSPRQTYRRER